MPTVRLTEKTVAKLDAPDPSGRQMLYWCEELKGFGVLVSGTTQSKSYVVQRQLPNGLKRRVTIAAVAETKLADAREKAARVLLVMREKDPKASRQSNSTLRQVLDAYLAARSQLRPRSVDAYRDGVERHLKTWLDLPLGKITPEMVEQRHSAIAAEVKEAGRGSGHATANGVMRSLKALWNFAAERDPDLPKVNPVTRLRRVWFDVPRRRRLVKGDDLPRFYAAVSTLRSAVARDFVLLLLFTGLRKTEAASLKWSDIDLKDKVIRVAAASTKGNRYLELPVSDLVHELLVSRRALGDTTWVFPSNSKTGRIMDAKFPLKLVAKETGIVVSAHDLRRTFLTAADACDLSALATKVLVNHSTGGDITAGYIIMSRERLREAAQRVTDKLKELCNVAPVEGANVKKLKA